MSAAMYAHSYAPWVHELQPRSPSRWLANRRSASSPTEWPKLSPSLSVKLVAPCLIYPTWSPLKAIKIVMWKVIKPRKQITRPFAHGKWNSRLRLQATDLKFVGRRNVYNIGFKIRFKGLTSLAMVCTRQVVGKTFECCVFSISLEVLSLYLNNNDYM